MGVCGGVDRGREGGCEELVAVTSGTEPRVGVGLFTTDPVACWTGGCVATDDTEFERAGLAGGACAALTGATGLGLVGGALV